MKTCESHNLHISCVSTFMQLTEAQGAVRMISQGKGNLLLIGTTRNMILQGSFDLKFSPIMQVAIAIVVNECIYERLSCVHFFPVQLLR